MLKIRLALKGRKKAPSYRIVVTNVTSPRDGKHIEILGFYNPSHNPAQIKIDQEKLNKWIKNGAQVTDAVKKLVDGKYEYKVYNKESRKRAEEEAAAQEAAKAEAQSQPSTETKTE